MTISPKTASPATPLPVIRRRRINLEQPDTVLHPPTTPVLSTSQPPKPHHPNQPTNHQGSQLTRNLAASTSRVSRAIVRPRPRNAKDSVALSTRAEGVLGAGARLEHGAALELGGGGGDGDGEEEGEGGDGELHFGFLREGFWV